MITLWLDFTLMLTQFVYTSRPCFDPLSASGSRMLGNIVELARRNNAAHAISGILLVGRNWLAQVLEGERADLNGAIARILADERHKDLRIAGPKFLGKRRFAAWPLGMATSTRDCPPIEKLVEMTAADFLELTRAAPPSTLNQPA